MSEAAPTNALTEARLRRARTMRGFTIAVGASLLAHAGGLALAVWASAPVARPRLEPAIPVQLVKLGKKRDPSLLPRLVADAPPPSDPDVVKLDDGRPKPPSDKQKKPSTEPQLSDRARELLSDRAVDRTLDRALEKVEGEGDPDGDVNGTTTDATNAATGYARDVSRALKQAYRLPDTIPAGQRQFLKARVLLFIDRGGHITRFEFVESHPNAAFMGALESMLRTLVLPAPPADKARAFEQNGLEVIFSP